MAIANYENTILSYSQSTGKLLPENINNLTSTAIIQFTNNFLRNPKKK